MCVRLNSNQYSQLDRIATKIADSRTGDGVVRSDEIDNVAAEITNFFQDKGNASLGVEDIDKLKTIVAAKVADKLKAANFSPSDSTLSSLISSGFNKLGKEAKGVGAQVQQAIKGSEGTLSSVDRKLSKGDGIISRAYRAAHNVVSDDKVMSNGNNVSQQKKVQDSINQVRSGLRSEILAVEKKKFNDATSTNCASDSLDKLGVKHTFGKGAQVVTEATLESNTKSKWTGMSISKDGGFTKSEQLLLAKNGGKILVQEGNHTMVGTFDIKTGKVFADGREIKKGNVFVQGEIAGVRSSAKTTAQLAQTFKAFSAGQADFDPHFKTESSDQRNLKKMGVLFTDKAPSSRKALNDVAAAASSGNMNEVAKILKANGIEMSSAMIKNVMSTMTAKFDPPKEFKNNSTIGGESLGKASNMFEAFKLLGNSKAKEGTINSILGGLEQTNPKNTMDKFLLSDGGSVKNNAEEMFNQFQALANGRDGC